MSIEYGRGDCQHDFVYRKEGWLEGCVPAVCLECGAYGCQCDVDFSHGSREQTIESARRSFFERGVKGNANINGRWVNPYILNNSE
jgi:hypothetical protein